MTTIELIFNGILIALGLVLVVVIIRYPRAVFIEFPLAILSAPFGSDLFADLFKGAKGKDTRKYKTIRRKYLTFATCHKFLITGTDEGMVRLKITDILPLINKKLKMDHFTFVTASEQTITIPPADISCSVTSII